MLYGIDLELNGSFVHNTMVTCIPPKKSTRLMLAMSPETCEVQRRSDGVVLVRVHSRDRQGRLLPDAVFTFRLGDPQYDYWERQLRQPMQVLQP